MVTDKQAAIKTAECINSLIPIFRQRVGDWYEAMLARGVTPYVYFGSRTMAEQQRLYDLHLKGGPLAAEPGKSLHNFGMAIDWVPLKPMSDLPGFYEADWDNDKAYELGEDVGKEFNLAAISQETGHLQDGRAPNWRDAKRIAELAQWPTV